MRISSAAVQGSPTGFRKGGEAFSSTTPKEIRVGAEMISRDNARRGLLEILTRWSYEKLPEPIRLSSGKFSDEYIDCKKTTLRGDAMPLVGALCLDMIPTDVQAVGGLTMGADAIASALAYSAQDCGRLLHAFVVRKEPKEHGLKKLLEGPVGAGSRVVVVDDVVTTGKSTLTAIEKCRAEGLVIAGVIVLVDREEDDGMDRIREAAGEGVPVRALFTKSELAECQQRQQHASHEHPTPERPAAPAR